MRSSILMRLLVVVGSFSYASTLHAAEKTASRPTALDRQWAVGVCASYLGGLGAEDIWSAARSVGITRLEAYLDEELGCPHLFEKNGTPYRIDTSEARAALCDKLAKEKIAIGCFAKPLKLEADGSADEAALRWVRKAAVAVSDMEGTILMLPIGISDAKGQKAGDDSFIARGKAFMRGLDRIAADTGVQIVIENLGPYWNRPEILEPVLKESRPDRVGLLLDITNMYWFGHPLDRLYELAKQFAPYVRYVHVKNIRYPEDQRQKQRSPGWEYGKYAEPVRTGDVDFIRILDIVSKAGYVGDLTIEDDSLPHFDASGKKKTLADDAAYLGEWIKSSPRPR